MYRAIAFLPQGDRCLKEDVYSIDSGAVRLKLKTCLMIFQWETLYLH